MKRAVAAYNILATRNVAPSTQLFIIPQTKIVPTACLRRFADVHENELELKPRMSLSNEYNTKWRKLIDNERIKSWNGDLSSFDKIVVSAPIDRLTDS